MAKDCEDDAVKFTKTRIAAMTSFAKKMCKNQIAIDSRHHSGDYYRDNECGCFDSNGERRGSPNIFKQCGIYETVCYTVAGRDCVDDWIKGVPGTTTNTSPNVPKVDVGGESITWDAIQGVSQACKMKSVEMNLECAAEKQQCTDRNGCSK